MKNFFKVANDFANNLNEIARSMIIPVKIIQDASKKVGNFILNANKLFEDLGYYLKKFGEIVDSFSYLMIEADWPPPLDITPNKMLDMIEFRQNHTLEETKQEISKFLIEFYDSKKIEKKFNLWIKKEWFKKRKHILKAIVEAHKDKQYILSIPAMLIQIEGIIVDGYGHLGWLNQSRLKKYIKNLYPENKYHYPGEVIKEILINTILVKFEHGKKINSSLSRHAILHGADVNYGSEENSLRSLLLFDYLQRSFKLLSIKGSRIYHKIGCPRIIKSKKDKKVYSSEQKAKNDDKIPCKICIGNKNSQA